MGLGRQKHGGGGKGRCGGGRGGRGAPAVALGGTRYLDAIGALGNAHASLVDLARVRVGVWVRVGVRVGLGLESVSNPND